MDNLIIAQCGVCHIHGILDNKRNRWLTQQQGLMNLRNHSLSENRQIAERGRRAETVRLIGSKEIL